MAEYEINKWFNLEGKTAVVKCGEGILGKHF